MVRLGIMAMRWGVKLCINRIYLHIDVSKWEHRPEVVVTRHVCCCQLAYWDDMGGLSVGQSCPVDGGMGGIVDGAEDHRLSNLALRVQEVV